MIFNQNTTEVVSPYHPDKIADRISDYLAQWHQPGVRSAIETIIKDNTIFVAGESNRAEYITHQKVIQAVQAVYDLKIDNYYPDYESIETIIRVTHQSPNISDIINKHDGAGDNGVMYGCYYHNHINIHEMLHMLMWYIMRNTDALGDAKLIYRDGTLTLNAHTKYVDDAISLREYVMKHRITRDLQVNKVYVNPNGAFLIGGPFADAGVTGRKIINDAHGTGIPHGGGAFHGKDLSKVDRSGAYYAQHLADKYGREFETNLLVELSYIIGDAYPNIIVYTGKGIDFDIDVYSRMNKHLSSRSEWVEYLQGFYTEIDHVDYISSHFPSLNYATSGNLPLIM